MDLRRTPGADQWQEWKAAILRSRSPHAEEVYLWITRSHNGIRLAARYPGTETGTTVVPRYLGHVRRIIREVTTKGSYLTSEFAAAPTG